MDWELKLWDSGFIFEIWGSRLILKSVSLVRIWDFVFMLIPEHLRNLISQDSKVSYMI